MQKIRMEKLIIIGMLHFDHFSLQDGNRISLVCISHVQVLNNLIQTDFLWKEL